MLQAALLAGGTVVGVVAWAAVGQVLREGQQRKRLEALERADQLGRELDIKLAELTRADRSPNERV